MANEIDIDIDEYNRRMDALDEQVRQVEREEQQREIIAMVDQMEPVKGFHFNVAFPTSYLEDADGVAIPQSMALGDATPLFDILNNYGLHIMYGKPMKNPKVVGIIIGGDWTEVSVEWDLE